METLLSSGVGRFEGLGFRALTSFLFLFLVFGWLGEALEDTWGLGLGFRGRHKCIYTDTVLTVLHVPKERIAV